MEDNLNNFIDPITKKEFFYSNYKMFPQLDKTIIYKDKNLNQIRNPESGTILEFIEVEDDRPYTAPFIGKTNNKASLKAMLTKRSQDHFKKEIADVKHEKNQQLRNEIKNK